MKLSVIIPTYRKGGFDTLFGSLKNQTFRDYEVVVVDDLYDWRKDEVKKYADLLDIPLVHVPPKPVSDPARVFNCNNAQNTGLIVADGDYVLPSQDFMWFAPDCFERHMKFQKHGRVTVGIMDHYTSFPLGNLNGKITVFDRVHEEPPSPSHVELEDKRWPYQEGEDMGNDLRKFTFYLYTSNYSLLPNAVFPYHYGIHLNGFDERLDIGHGFQDDNWIFRGVLTNNYEFVLDKRNVSIHLTHPWDRRRQAPTQQQLHYGILDSILKGISGIRAPNTFDILQERLRWKHTQWVAREGGLERPVQHETYQRPYEQERLGFLKLHCGETDSILDVGCSGGYVLAYLLGDKWPHTPKSCGLDVNPDIVTANQQTYPEVQWVCHNIENGRLPFDDKSFDVVLLTGVLEHLPFDCVPLAIIDATRVCRRKVLIQIPSATNMWFDKQVVESVGKHRWALTMDRIYALSLTFFSQFWNAPIPTRTDYGLSEAVASFIINRLD